MHILVAATVIVLLICIIKLSYDSGKSAGEYEASFKYASYKNLSGLDKNNEEDNKILSIKEMKRLISSLKAETNHLRQHIRSSEKVKPSTWMINESKKIVILDSKSKSWVLPFDALKKSPFGKALHAEFLDTYDKKLKLKQKKAPVNPRATNASKG